MDIKSQAVVIASPWRTRSGNYLRLISASLPVTVRFLRKGNEIGKWENVTSGTAGYIEDENGKKQTFDTAEITTSGDQTIKAAVGFGSAELTATSVSVSQPTVIDTAADVALTAAVATLVLGADATRRAALISNLIGNASSIRVGDSNTGAARGVQVGAGQTVTIEGTEAIYAYSATGQSVGVVTIKD